MQVGDQVILLAPFNVSYPDVYTVVSLATVGDISINLPGYEVTAGADFDPVYVQKVS